MKNNHKRTCLLSVLMVLVFCLTSCGHLQPKTKGHAEVEAALAGYVKKLQKADFSKASSYVASSSLEEVQTGEIYDEILKAYLSTISYTLSSCSQNDNKGSGTAAINLSFADLSDILDSFEGSYTIGDFVSEITSKKAPTRQEKVNVDFVKEDKWKLDTDEEIVAVLFEDWEEVCAPFLEMATSSTTETSEDPSESTPGTTVSEWDLATDDINKEGWYSYDTKSYQLKPSSSQYYSEVTSTIEYSIRFNQYYELEGFYELYDEDGNLVLKEDVTSYSLDGYGFLDCTCDYPESGTFPVGEYRLKLYIHNYLVRDESVDVRENETEGFDEVVISEGFFNYDLEDYVKTYKADSTDVIEYSFHLSEDRHVIVFFTLEDENGDFSYSNYAATYAADTGGYLDCTCYDDEELFPAGTYTMTIYLGDEVLRELELVIE